MKLFCTLAASTLALTLAPGVARAGDAQCLWEHVDANTRAVIANDLEADVVRDISTYFDDAEVKAAARACGASKGHLYAEQQALITLVFQRSQERSILRVSKVTSGQLDVAWRKIDIAKRLRLGALLAEGSLDDPAVKALTDDLAEAMTSLFPQSIPTALGQYVRARAYREHNERQF